MALRRYLFVMKASNPLEWVDRYLASDNPANNESTRSFGNVSWAPTSYFNVEGEQLSQEVYAQLRTQWQGVYRRVGQQVHQAGVSWAVADAGQITEADGAEGVPGQMRRFLEANEGPTDQWVHICNRELAMAWADEMRRAPLVLAIGQQTPEQQYDAVLRLWQAFANYWRALNVIPWAWAPLRMEFERAFGEWGSNTSATAHNSGWRTTRRPYIGRRIYWTDQFPATFPDGIENVTDLLFVREPTTLQIAAAEAADRAGYQGGDSRRPPATGRPGMWRRMAYTRFAAAYPDFQRISLTDQNFVPAPHDVRFGSERVVEEHAQKPEDDCGKVGQPDFAYESRCYGATGDVHRLWIRSDATLGGNWWWGPRPTESERAQPDHIDCAARDAETGGDRGPFMLQPAAGQFGWLCATMSRDNRDVFGGAGEWLYFNPPLLWYYQLLQPLAAILAESDPLQIVYETRLDVLGKNLWLSIASGNGGNALELLSRMPRVRVDDVAGTLRDIGSVTAVAGGVVAIGNALVGAAVGLVGAGMQFASSLFPQQRVWAGLDVFGRPLPTVERLWIVPAFRWLQAPPTNGRKVILDRLDVQANMPPAPPGFDDRPMGIEEVSRNEALDRVRVMQVFDGDAPPPGPRREPVRDADGSQLSEPPSSGGIGWGHLGVVVVIGLFAGAVMSGGRR